MINKLPHPKPNSQQKMFLGTYLPLVGAVQDTSHGEVNQGAIGDSEVLGWGETVDDKEAEARGY